MFASFCVTLWCITCWLHCYNGVPGSLLASLGFPLQLCVITSREELFFLKLPWLQAFDATLSKVTVIPYQGHTSFANMLPVKDIAHGKYSAT